MRHEKTELNVFVAWPRPSFFWYDTEFSEFHSADIIDYILEKSASYQKKDGHGHARPSFFWYDNSSVKIGSGPSSGWLNWAPWTCGAVPDLSIKEF